jgi:hypothetical protein
MLKRTMSSRMRSKEETERRGIQSLPSAVEVHSGCSARLTTRVIMPPGGSNAQHFTLRHAAKKGVKVLTGAEE